MNKAFSDVVQRRAEQSAEVLLAGDTASAGLGIELISVAPGLAQLRMVVTATMLNGHKTCHGGYLFTFADSAFAVACNSFNRVTVAASAEIEFLASGKLDDVLIADASMRHSGRRSGIYDVVVSREDGQELALFRGRSHSFDEPLFDESD